MFTGIIEAVGNVARLEAVGGDLRLTVNTTTLDMTDVGNGDSIAVNGVCLTAIEFNPTKFTADVSSETVNLTTLKDLTVGSAVNLEKALLPTTRLGGHLVSGHVDGIGKIMEISSQARSIQLLIQVPDKLKRYIAVKGSVCIDGTSLTVNTVNDNTFSVNIVPHTQQQTIIKTYSPGSWVNLEVDLIARYLERLLQTQDGDSAADISMTTLADAGFIQ